MTQRNILRWILLIVPVWIIAEFLKNFGVPAPFMVTALIAGIVVALAGKLPPAALPSQVSLATQSLFGVLVGSYCQMTIVSKVGFTLVPVASVALVTLLMSGVIGYVFSRIARVDLPTAVLGLMAGGAPAVVAAAEDLEAEVRTVAFMQYLRVALVAATTPAIAAMLNGEGATVVEHEQTLSEYFKLVGHEDQLAGVSIAVVLCIVGVWLGRRIKLPNAPLVGPMLLTAVVTMLGFSYGYAPANTLKELVFVLMGLEIGIRFTKPVVVHMIRMLPAMTAAIGALALSVSVVAVILVAVTGLPAYDVYLSTTPGGLSAVLGIAESTGANVPLIAGSQTVRLFLMVLILPVMLRILRGYSERSQTTAAVLERSGARSSGQVLSAVVADGVSNDPQAVAGGVVSSGPASSCRHRRFERFAGSY